MDRTGSVIVNLARAIAVRALPITLDGPIRLKLRQLLLQMQLNFFGFFEGKAKIVETSIIDTSLNVGNFATPSNADPHKLDGDDHLQLCGQRVPFPKSTRLPGYPYPTVFHSQSNGPNRTVNCQTTPLFFKQSAQAHRQHPDVAGHSLGSRDRFSEGPPRFDRFRGPDRIDRLCPRPSAWSRRRPISGPKRRAGGARGVAASSLTRSKPRVRSAATVRFSNRSAAIGRSSTACAASPSGTTRVDLAENRAIPWAAPQLSAMAARAVKPIANSRLIMPDSINVSLPCR